MKIIKHFTKSMLMLLIVFLLAVCSKVDGNNETDNLSLLPEETTSTHYGLENVPSVYSLTGLWVWNEEEWTNRIYLRDFSKGSVSYFELNLYQQMMNWWYLGEGQHAIWLTEQRDDGDTLDEIIIVNEELEKLESIPYDLISEPWLWSAQLRVENGEIIAFANEVGTWDPNKPNRVFNPIRHNIRTKETTILARLDYNISTFHEFINEDEVFVTYYYSNQQTRERFTRYGIFNVNTGVLDSLVVENFHINQVILSDEHAMITQKDTTNLNSNTVIVYHLINRTSEQVTLNYATINEQDAVQFSYDGQSILVVNGEERVIRKFNLDGDLILEINIDLFSNFKFEVESWAENYDTEFEMSSVFYEFDIIPIAPTKYFLITTAHPPQGIARPEPHVQVIILYD